MSLAHNPKIAKNGLVLLLDAANPRCTLSTKQSSNILLDPHTAWTAGTDGVSGYGRNGDITEQSRALRTDPWGGTSMTWRSTPDAVSGADGGWNSSYYAIDTNYTYRFSVWVKRYTSGTGGTFYMGMNPAPIRNDTNAVQSNPYFTYPGQGSLVLDQWYLVVAHCFHEGYTGGRHPDSGWYQKTATGGTKITDFNYGNIGAEDCRWDPGTTTAMHRAYHYYTTNTASGLEWAFPRLDKCDGTEPKIQELLKYGEGKWNDLSGNGNDGIIGNHLNVTWSPDFGGVYSFDATVNGSYIDVPSPNLATVDSTIIAVSRYNGATRGRIVAGYANNYLLGHHSAVSSAYYGEGWVRNASDNDTNWRIYTATRDHSLDYTSYWENGVKIVTNSTAASQGPNGFSIGRYAPGNSQYTTGQVGYLAAYNRVLSDNEIVQITDALRGRYDI